LIDAGMATSGAALLGDIATREVRRFRSDGPLREAVAAMAESGISSIVVTDRGGRPVGIVTEQNVLAAVRSRLADDTLLCSEWELHIAGATNGSAASGYLQARWCQIRARSRS